MLCAYAKHHPRHICSGAGANTEKHIHWTSAGKQRKLSDDFLAFLRLVQGGKGGRLLISCRHVIRIMP